MYNTDFLLLFLRNMLTKIYDFSLLFLRNNVYKNI